MQPLPDEKASVSDSRYSGRTIRLYRSVTVWMFLDPGDCRPADWTKSVFIPVPENGDLLICHIRADLLS